MTTHITLRAPINTGNRYCGPAVISAIAHIGTAEAASVIRGVTGKRFVKGTSYSACRQALRQLGFLTKPIVDPLSCLDDFQKPTLAKWLREHKSKRTTGRVFLICAGHHWFAVTGRRYVCGIVKEIVSIKDPRVKRRARVARAYEVVRAPF